MKKRTIFSFILLMSILSTAGASIRTKYNFNPDWKIFVGNDSTAKNVVFDDSKWKSVNLPQAITEDEAFKAFHNSKVDTVFWYRKTFSIPSEFKDQKVFIEFEGAKQAAEVWVNGKKVGVHENGVMAFGFDLTDFLKKKDNVIAIRVNNSPNYKERSTGTPFQWNDEAINANFGGLTRNVFLHITDRLYQTLPLYSSLKTKGMYVYADNCDVKGKRAVLHIESEVKNDYDSPKTMVLNVIVRDNDKLLVREFQSEQVTLQPGETKVVSAFASMKNLFFWSWGYGYLYEVNASITVGKKVIDAVRVKTGFRKTDFKNGIFKLNDRAMQLKGYAQSSANEWPGAGPSVPAWLSDYSNKQMLEGNANIVRWMHVTPSKQDIESCDRIGLIEAMPAGDGKNDMNGRMWEQRKELMRDAIIYNRNNPSIIFYEAGNSGISESQMTEMLDIKKEFDPKGGRAMGCAGMLDSEIAEYSGDLQNVNKSADQPVWAMDYSSQSENQNNPAMESVARWYDFWRERPGTGRRVNAGAVCDMPVDMRFKNDAWWANYVMWDGWVDTENFHSHIIGHWNYEPGSKNNVYVVSTGDQVELFLNNKRLGFGEQTNRFLFTFRNVAFQPGELRAVSYDKSKVSVSEAVCKTAGNPKSIKLNLKQGPDGLHADGADMILVEAEVLDEKGQRCPLSKDLIQFEIKGQVEKDLHSKQLPADAGVSRILLRSTREAGLVTVVAKSGNLIPDSLFIKSEAIDAIKGLTSFLPNTKQLSSLTRGETPATNSYQVSRIPVSVISVKAGSNEKDAFFSFDDNEQSKWESNDIRSKAWIEYTLAHQGEFSEISLKLAGWRDTSYPIRVLNENGIVLWEGITEKSYGYVTLPLKKGVNSETIRIELQTAGKDNVSNIKDQLNIIEIEFYESAE